MILAHYCLVCTCYASTCFPLTQGWGEGPSGISRDQWWCKTFDSFLGYAHLPSPHPIMSYIHLTSLYGPTPLYSHIRFSYPVEDDDCGDYSYEGFKSDFQHQKQQYNATFVRIYLPVCRETSFWVNMISAARDTSMGLIPMIFWDWYVDVGRERKSYNECIQIIDSFIYCSFISSILLFF